MFEKMTTAEFTAMLEQDPALLAEAKQCYELIRLFNELSPDGKEEVIKFVESMQGGEKMADALRQISGRESASK